MLTVFGVILYIVVPMSYLNGNPGIWIFLMNSLLLLTIVGLGMLAQVIQNPFEKCLARVSTSIFQPDRKIRPLLIKNLDGHQRRN